MGIDRRIASPGADPVRRRGILVRACFAISLLSVVVQAYGQPVSDGLPELVVQTGIDAAVEKIAFSSDGRLLASMHNNGNVKLWQVATGHALHTFRDLCPEDYFSACGASAAMSFSHDVSELFVFAGGRIHRFEIRSRQALEVPVPRQLGSPSWAAFADGGRILATADADFERFRFHEVDTGREMASLAPIAEAEIDLEALLSGAGSIAAGGQLKSAALSPDGGSLATVVSQASLILGETAGIPGLSEKLHLALWDVASGREAWRYDLAFDAPPLSAVEAPIAFSADGVRVGVFVQTSDLRSVAGVSAEAAADPALMQNIRVPRSTHLRIWDALTGRVVAGQDTSEREGQLVSSPADLALLAGGAAGAVLLGGDAVRVTDLDGGRERFRRDVDPLVARSVAIGGDNRLLAYAAQDAIRIWALATGVLATTLARDVSPATNAVFDEDDSLVLTSSAVNLLQRGNGNLRSSLELSPGFRPGRMPVLGLPILSPGGRVVAHAPGEAGPVKVWETATGSELHELVVPAGDTYFGGRFSPDRRLLALLRMPGPAETARRMQAVRAGGTIDDVLRIENRIRVWNLESGSLSWSFASSPAGNQVAFSPDGAVLADGSMTGLRLWDLDTGRELGLLGSEEPIYALAWSPDGEILAVAQADPGDAAPGSAIVLWDTGSRQPRQRLRVGPDIINLLAFDRSGRHLAATGYGREIRVWSVADGVERRSFSGHADVVHSLDFNADGSLLLSSSFDGATRIWDMATGKLLATIAFLDDGTEWLAVTPDGLFDGTAAAWRRILWRFSDDTFDVSPLEIFFNEYYYPGLLADIVAGKAVKAPVNIADKDRRQPVVELAVGRAADEAPPETRELPVTIRIADAPAGARDVRLFRNGSLVRAWRGDVLGARREAVLETTVRIVRGENRLNAYAFNRDNIKSADAELTVIGADSLDRAGTMYVLAIGIDEYSNADYNLRYAVADARAFADELALRQRELSIYAETRLIALHDRDATKANILDAIRKRLRNAQPEDAVIVYFAGHGTASGQRYYLLPHDLGHAGSRTRLDEAAIGQILGNGISDIDLEQALERVDAGKLMMVIDACNSGQALDAEEKRRGPMNSKGLAQLAYEKGMYILTASQSYQAALEGQQLGHGYLTYVLVEEGLKTAAADRSPRDAQVTAVEWVDFAAGRVPALHAELSASRRGSGAGRALFQQPRVFYRRESARTPLIVARVPAR